MITLTFEMGVIQPVSGTMLSVDKRLLVRIEGELIWQTYALI